MTLLAVRNQVVEFTGRSDLDKKTLLTNGYFEDSPFGWHLSSGWTWEASGDYGKITHSPGVPSDPNIEALYQFYPFVRVALHGYYKVAFTVSDCTAGSVTVYLGDNGDIGSAAISADGDYELNLWCQDRQLAFYPTTDFDGSISAVSLTDLSTGVAVTAKADFYINEAQKVLDSMNISPKQRAWYKKDIASGEYTLNLKYCTAIERVYVADADGERELRKRSLDWLKENASVPYSNITSGTPSSYVIFPIGLSPEQSSLTEEDYTDEFSYSAEGISFGDYSKYKGILFLPPADGTYTVSIYGTFMSPELSSDFDTSYWTEVRPLALVIASCMLIECAMRNFTGYESWKKQLYDLLSGIDNERVREELAKVKGLKGERGQ